MRILIVNGPNLNMLGERDQGFYGSKTLAEILEDVYNTGTKLGIDVNHVQSNHEGYIIDFLQRESRSSDGIIINAGALTHYGLALRDSLADTKLPVVELHLSNIFARDEFRQHSFIEGIAVGQIAGLGWKGYSYALESLADYLRSKSS